MDDFFLRLAGLIVLFFAAIFLFQKIVAKKLPYKLYRAIKAPSFAFIAVVFLSWALTVLQSKWKFEISAFTIETFRNCAFLGLFCFAYIRIKKFYLESLIEKLSDKKNFLYRETIEVASNVFSALVYVATFFALLQISGVNVIPFVTFGGLGLAVFGIAGKDFMSNFFAGLSLKITNPFKEGEFVEIPDKKVSGIVQKIGFFSTRIVDEKCRVVLVPNVLFSSTSLINGSRSTHFVFSEIFDIGKVSLLEASSLEKKISECIQGFSGVDISKNFQILINVTAQKTIKIEVIVYFLKKKGLGFAVLRNALMNEIFEIIESKK